MPARSTPDDDTPLSPQLRGQSFRGQALEGAEFGGAGVRGTDFTGANLRSASFRDARVGPKLWIGLRFSQQRLLPPWGPVF